MDKKTIIKFILGLFLGYLISLLLAGSQTGKMGIMPSIIFNVKNYKFHLHHWFLFSLILLSQFLFDYSFPVIFNGFLVGGAIQGIVNYSDWYQIVLKVVLIKKGYFI